MQTVLSKPACEDAGASTASGLIIYMSQKSSHVDWEGINITMNSFEIFKIRVESSAHVCYLCTDLKSQTIQRNFPTFREFVFTVLGENVQGFKNVATECCSFGSHSTIITVLERTTSIARSSGRVYSKVGLSDQSGVACHVMLKK